MRTALGAAVVAVLSLLAAPAYAGQLTVHDRTGDVNEGRMVDGRPDGASVVQSNVREGDVVATTFRHGPRNIVVTSTFRTLDAVGHYHGYHLRLLTGAKVYREVDVTAGTGNWRGAVTVTRRNGARVPCAVGHRIDYARNFVRVVVPRTCLGRPTYVRATAAKSWLRHDPDPSQGDRVYVDNPHDTSTDTNAWTRWIRKG